MFPKIQLLFINATYMFLLPIKCYCIVDFDMSTHTNGIFKMTYNELRLTTILSNSKDTRFHEQIGCSLFQDGDWLRTKSALCLLHEFMMTLQIRN